MYPLQYITPQAKIQARITEIESLADRLTSAIGDLITDIAIDADLRDTPRRVELSLELCGAHKSGAVKKALKAIEEAIS